MTASSAPPKADRSTVPSARPCRPVARPLPLRERCSTSRRAVRASTTAARSRSTRRRWRRSKANTGVIVVHGLDPTTLSAKAQAEKSDLVPSLPLAATSPALCGALVVRRPRQFRPAAQQPAPAAPRTRRAASSRSSVQPCSAARCCSSAASSSRLVPGAERTT